MKRWQDWTNLVLGVLLFIAPSVFGLSGAASTITYLVAIGVTLVSIWALGMQMSQVPEWCNVVIGIFYFIAPWLFGFTSGAWIAWIVGAAVAILSAFSFPVEPRQQPMRQAPAH